MHAILVSLFVISILSPGSYLDPGMELSYAALFGLALGNREQLSWLKRYLLSCTLATLFTGVITYVRFGTFQYWGILLNPILAPFLSFVACYGGILGLLLYGLGIDSEGGLLEFVADILVYLCKVLKALI